MTFYIENIKKKNQQIIAEVGIDNKEECFDITIRTKDYHAWLDREEILEWEAFGKKGKLSYESYWKEYDWKERYAHVKDYILKFHMAEVQKEIDTVNQEMIDNYKNDLL